MLTKSDLCLHTSGHGKCPDAKSREEYCDECPLIELESLDRGNYGYLFRAAQEWKSLMEDGFILNLDDIPADEVVALRVLRQETPREVAQTNGELKSQTRSNSY